MKTICLDAEEDFYALLDLQNGLVAAIYTRLTGLFWRPL